MPAFSDHIQANPNLNNQVMQNTLQGLPPTMQNPALTDRFMDDFSDDKNDENEPDAEKPNETEQPDAQATAQASIATNAPNIIRQIVGELAQALMDQLQQELDNDINNADLGEIANLVNISTALNHQLADFDAAAERRAQRMMGGLSEGVGEEIGEEAKKIGDQEKTKPEETVPEEATEGTAEETGAPAEGTKGGPAGGLPDKRKKQPYSSASAAPTPEEALGEQLADEGGEGDGDDPAQQAARQGELQKGRQADRNENREERGAKEAVAATKEEGDPEIEKARHELDLSSGRKTAKGSGAKIERGVHKKMSMKETSKNLTEKLAASIPSSMLKNPEVIAMLAVVKDMTDLFGSDEAAFKLINVTVATLLTVNYMNQGSYFQRMFYKRFMYRFMIAIGAEFIPGLDFLPSYTIMALYIWHASEQEAKRKAGILEKVRGALGRAHLT